VREIRCAICSVTQVVTLPGEAEVPGVPTVDAAESRLGWGSSSDGKVLCRWHAPHSRKQLLRNVVS
jgi:hypothetical protein